METVLLRVRITTQILFKSYYVVWKPIKVLATNNSGVLFKSYYVVWKRKKSPVNSDRSVWV